jgi:hypothetical protein
VSISVSVWTDSEEAQVYYDEIMASALPFESDYTADQFASAIRLFIQELCKSLHGPSGISFVRKLLVEQRYQPIFGETKDTFSSCHKEWQLTDNFQQKVNTIATLFQKIKQFSPENVNGQAIQGILLLETF